MKTSSLSVSIGKASLGVSGRSVNENVDANANVVQAPVRRSFEEFLLNDARVPVGRGVYEPYSFAGREPLLAVVRVVDRVLGAPVSDPARFRSSHTNTPAHLKTKARINAPGQETGAPAPVAPLPDAEISLAGGAQ